jgi:hypothetical protein
MHPVYLLWIHILVLAVVLCVVQGVLFYCVSATRCRINSFPLTYRKQPPLAAHHQNVTTMSPTQCAP